MCLCRTETGGHQSDSWDSWTVFPSRYFQCAHVGLLWRTLPTIPLSQKHTAIALHPHGGWPGICRGLIFYDYDIRLSKSARLVPLWGRAYVSIPSSLSVHPPPSTPVDHRSRCSGLGKGRWGHAPRDRHVSYPTGAWARKGAAFPAASSHALPVARGSRLDFSGSRHGPVPSPLHRIFERMVMLFRMHARLHMAEGPRTLPGHALERRGRDSLAACPSAPTGIPWLYSSSRPFDRHRIRPSAHLQSSCAQLHRLRASSALDDHSSSCTPHGLGELVGKMPRKHPRDHLFGVGDEAEASRYRHAGDQQID